MNEKALIPSLRVRFTEDSDIAVYGDGWFIYDERAIVHMPARALVELENELGMPLPDAMNEMRRSSVLGDLAGAWIAVRASDPALAGTFDAFTPIIMLAQWERVPVVEGKDPGTEGASPPEEKEETPTVILQTLPVAV